MFLLECLSPSCNPVSAVTSTGLPHRSASICGSSSYISPLQILDETCQFFECRVQVCVMLSSVTLAFTSHQGAFPLTVVACPTLSSHRRTAKFSKQSGLKACIAVSRNGTARAARPGQTQVCAKLAAATAKHIKLQQCKRFTCQNLEGLAAVISTISTTLLQELCLEVEPKST